MTKRCDFLRCDFPRCNCAPTNERLVTLCDDSGGGTIRIRVCSKHAGDLDLGKTRHGARLRDGARINRHSILL